MKHWGLWADEGSRRKEQQLHSAGRVCGKGTQGGPLWGLWEGNLSNLLVKEYLCEVKCYVGSTIGVSTHRQPVRRAGRGMALLAPWQK